MISYDDIPEDLNLTTYFVDRHVEEGDGDRPALITPSATYSYADVAKATNRIGNVLRELDVRPEERVLLAMSDGLDFVASWYAIIKIGAVVAEAYTFLQPKDYAYYLNYTRAGVVIVDETTRAKVASVAGECPRLRRRLVAGEPADLQSGESSLRELERGGADFLEPAETTRDDIALWKFTTGSTGVPKAAVHCMHDPVVSFHNYAIDVIGYQQSDVVLPVPKQFFGYARDMTTLFTFGVGATGIVFPERSTPELLFDLIERHRPTIMVHVPTMMNAMATMEGASSRDLSSLRFVVSSGEALPRAVYEKWLDVFGIEVLEGIGSSEAYHVYISNRPGSLRPGSAGRLVPGYRARIVDADGNEVPDGEVGELHVEGESTALFYWGDHARSKHTFSGDAMRTGDLFMRDEDGFYWYQGRADDLLKVSGIFVAPLEIDACLRQHPLVMDCATIGYQKDGLKLPRSYVVTSGEPGSELSEQLKQFVRSELSPHKYPRDVRFINSLPTTPNGKIDRRALKALDAQPTSRSPDVPTPG